MATFTSRNRLVKHWLCGGIFLLTAIFAIAAHDADGNRVSKTVNGTTTSYLVEDCNPTGYAQVMQERNGSGDLTVSYTYGLGLISQTRGSTTSYFGFDGLGSVRYLTSATGGVTDTYDYDAFGIQIANTGTTVNNYRYTGQQWDSDLGMYYLRARYLNPQTGRFWTMDSFEGGSSDPLSLHKYTYCQNNPPNLVDPTGHYSSYEQVLGYDAEEAIQDLYVQQHPGDKISLSKREFRKDNPLRWLFPDIYNRTQSKWLEVKPLSPTG